MDENKTAQSTPKGSNTTKIVLIILGILVVCIICAVVAFYGANEYIKKAGNYDTYSTPTPTVTDTVTPTTTNNSFYNY